MAVIWLVLVFLQLAAAACPHSCTCHDEYLAFGIPGIDCSSKQLTHVPKTADATSGNFILDLRDNILRFLKNWHFDKTGYSSVEWLFLSDNCISRISEYAFYGLKNLKILDLINNNIRTLTKKTFAHLPSLEHLWLTNNPLVAISGTSAVSPPIVGLHMSNCLVKDLGDVFSENEPADNSWLKTLQYVSLSNNRISCISSAFVHSVKQQNSFLLIGNPLRCNCLVEGYEKILEHKISCWSLNSALDDDIYDAFETPEKDKCQCSGKAERKGSRHKLRHYRKRLLETNSFSNKIK